MKVDYAGESCVTRSLGHGKPCFELVLPGAVQDLPDRWWQCPLLPLLRGRPLIDQFGPKRFQALAVIARSARRAVRCVSVIREHRMETGNAEDESYPSR